MQSPSKRDFLKSCYYAVVSALLYPVMEMMPNPHLHSPSVMFVQGDGCEAVVRPRAGQQASQSTLRPLPHANVGDQAPAQQVSAQLCVSPGGPCAFPTTLLQHVQAV